MVILKHEHDSNKVTTVAAKRVCICSKPPRIYPKVQGCVLAVKKAVFPGGGGGGGGG